MDKNGVYYSATASSLSKRPLSEIHSNRDKEKRAMKKKKHFSNISSKVDCGNKKNAMSTQGHQSDGLTAKRKDELYGRLSAT